MKRILITGANRGVGLELARQLTTRGNHVFAGCRSPENATALEKLAPGLPGVVTILPLDVSDNASIADSAALVSSEVDALDVIFNNAAINREDEQLTAVKADVLLEVLTVNAIGPVLVAQKFLPLLKKGNDPKLVNISSEAGSISEMEHFRGYNYYGSKAALILNYLESAYLVTGKTLPSGKRMERRKVIEKDPCVGGWDIEVDHFVKAIRKGEQPEENLEVGISALKVALAAYASAKKGTAIKIA